MKPHLSENGPTSDGVSGFPKSDVSSPSSPLPEGEEDSAAKAQPRGARTNDATGQTILVEIQWKPIAGGTYTPGWSGYKAALYLTGYPDRGWCLYSRDGNGCWNQRTKQLIAPEVGAEPYRENDKWWWVQKNTEKGDDGTSNS